VLALCTTCGTQFAESEAPPEACPICQDERQYVPPEGQRWTTLEELRASHRAEIREEEPGLTGIGAEPSFAIGQRALLVQAPDGNVLWDCTSFLDDEIKARVEKLGGIAAISISHPHYYSSMVEWAEAFDAPIYLHAADREWVMRPSDHIVFWEEERRKLGPGLTLVRCGGHYEGGTVLHWVAGAEGRGALLSGDIVQVIPDRSYVSFMYSYPNLIPLDPAAVERIVDAVAPFEFEQIYGGWTGKSVLEAAGQAVRYSARRYLRAIGRRDRE
jgi:glyoxylase-like metal-dependent hydrolase (beta-lactamase superfamily II)